MSLFYWDTYFKELQKANSRLEVWDVYKNELKKIGFNHFLYAELVNPCDEITTNALHIEDDFPREWVDRYIECDYARNDFFIQHCLYSPQPIVWHSKQAEVYASKQHKDMMLEINDFNLNSGVTIPLHHVSKSKPAVVSLVTDIEDSEFQPFLIENVDSLYLASIYLFAVLQSKTDENNDVQLSNRQKEVLLWIYTHKSSKQISDILNLSERTVNLHIGLAMKKLQARTRHEAAAKAIALKLINP